MISRSTIIKYALAGVLILAVFLPGCIDVSQINDIIPRTTATQVEASALIVAGEPVGPAKGKIGEKLSFAVPVDSKVQGELIYEFDWGDGSISQSDSFRESHAFENNGVYIIRAKIRCGDIESDISPGKMVIIGKAVLSRTPINLPEHAMYYITPDAKEVKEKTEEILASTWRKPYSDFGAIREWVSTQITYEYDSDVYGVSDYWQLPVETLEKGTGDCEDVAILLCSMLRASGVSENNVFVAVGCVPGVNSAHAYLFEHCTSGLWKVMEPQIDPVTSSMTLQLVDLVSTHDYSDDILCFNDKYYFQGSPALPQGMYEVELMNSFWPIFAGASVEYARELGTGDVIKGQIKWYGDDRFMFPWTLNIYGPEDDIVLTWDGKELVHDFMFAVNKQGIYKVEVMKRDYVPRCLRVTIEPSDWKKLLR
jgi:predicted transglutaminase-like cysteine proteinase